MRCPLLCKFLLLLALIPLTRVNAQSIATFQSVPGGPQQQVLVLPPTHTFQKIAESGMLLPAGAGTLGINLDFTGYVPINHSSTNGYLSISSETTPAEVCVFDAQFNAATQLWQLSAGQKVNFPFNEMGEVSRFCSGTITPDRTVVVSEESLGPNDYNGDGYQDQGWLIEIDPATRTVIDQNGDGLRDKIWAMGRHVHENSAFNHDQSIIYWGADANPTGYLYKFVPTSRGNLTGGKLYVLRTTSALGTGQWVQVPNTTQAQRNQVAINSTAVDAYNFNGIEDVEIGPDGKIYFAAKGPGRIYRFQDNGNSVTQLQVFVENTTYDIDGPGNLAPVLWGYGNDNLCFDGEGNLWVLQDGGDNHIWVVGPNHSALNPAVRLFGKTPDGSEPTGITFTPDYKFMFLSFQHPWWGNSTPQPDASGSSVIFNNHTTVVIARREFLGLCGAPGILSQTNVTPSSALLNWTPVPGATGYDVDYKPYVSAVWTNAVMNTSTLSWALSGLTPGTAYQWRVRSHCGADSSAYYVWGFTTLPPCPGPLDISGNDLATGAATIPFNVNTKGTIFPQGDRDYYRFTKVNAGQVTVNLTTLPSNYNLEIRSAADVLISSSSQGGTTSESIIFVAGANTTYYAVVVPNNMGYHATSCYTLRVSAFSARVDVEPMSELKAWPVPVQEQLSIEVPAGDCPAEALIYSPTGALLLSAPLRSEPGLLDVSSLPAGMYLLQVTCGEEKWTMRFVKE